MSCKAQAYRLRDLPVVILELLHQRLVDVLAHGGEDTLLGDSAVEDLQDSCLQCLVSITRIIINKVRLARNTYRRHQRGLRASTWPDNRRIRRERRTRQEWR